jgi:N4-gp56 family major capsid protein
MGGVTDFGRLQPERALDWGHAAFEVFRDNFYLERLTGKGEGNVIERIDELTRTKTGEDHAMIHLIDDLKGGGVVGDNTLDGRERELSASWQKIEIDQLRNGVINKGRMADQRSVIQFRRPAKDKLGRWLADTMEDLGILTLSGISYAFNTDGSARATPEGQDELTELLFASDVAPPSANRHFRWDATTGLEAGDTTQVAAADVPTYNMLIDVAAEADTRGLKRIKRGGKEYFIFMVHTKTMARLFKDPDFRSVIVGADVRGEGNAIFSGAIVTMHGLVIHPYRRTYNTLRATTKWGAGDAIDGTRSLLLGSQALALADLHHDTPEWDEEYKDYKNRRGIAVGKMFGYLKPQFPSAYDGGSLEDFGVMAVDHAI